MTNLIGDYRFVYVARQVQKPTFQPTGKRWDTPWRKFGATSLEPKERLADLSKSGSKKYVMVRYWHRPNDALAVEWVVRQLLTEYRAHCYEYVSASAKQCVAAVEMAIRLVEARDFSQWPKAKWPMSIRIQSREYAVNTLNNHFPGVRQAALIAAGKHKP